MTPGRSEAVVARGKAGRFLQNKLLRGAAIGLAVFAATLLLWRLGAFQQLEWKSWDGRLRLLSVPSRASRDIVLIALDQDSLDVYAKQQNLPWPWPRQMYAALLDFLKAGGAKAVFLDIITTEPSGFGVDDDRALGAAIGRSGSVFLPFFLSKTARDDVTDVTTVLRRFALAEKNIPALAIHPVHSVTLPQDTLITGVHGMGNVQYEPDADSVYRRLPLVYRYDALLLPALPLALADFIGRPGDLREIPLDGEGRMILRYHGPAGTYKTYSIAAVINSQAQIEEGKPPQIQPAEFAGKTVIVGMTAPGLFDLRPTPFGGVYSGMEILATALDNLLHKEAVKPVSAPVTAAFIFGLSLLAGLGTTLLRRIWHLAAWLIIALAVPVVSAWTTFSSGYWLEFAAPLFAVL
ncbi:MAG: CHASE2 domain-containing protein, partial [Candidatus Aminicenantales bacterium]